MEHLAAIKPLYYKFPQARLKKALLENCRLLLNAVNGQKRTFNDPLNMQNNFMNCFLKQIIINVFSPLIKYMRYEV